MIVLWILSLSLLMIGIFFIPWQILAAAACLFLIATMIVRRDEVCELAKKFALFAAFFVPVALIKLFSVQEGKEIPIAFFKVYSLGIEQSLTIFFRVIALYTGVGFVNRIFPMKTISEKMKGLPFAQAVFLSIDIFPQILSLLIPKNRKIEPANWIEKIDRIYNEIQSK